MPLASLFAIIAIFGLIMVVLDFGAKRNSPAPSMYRSDTTGWGILIFVVCGLLAAATYASFH
jgi:hypothetical protein